jgi:ParB/Sulfiredoxin domain
MASPHKRTAARGVGGGSGNVEAAKLDGARDNATQADTQELRDTVKASHWRNVYKVHPAADVFPMMTDDELAKLGEDIKANGLRCPIVRYREKDGNAFLLDGRNRLEAIERAGLTYRSCMDSEVYSGDPVSLIIGLNIHRRHLTKEQQADLIVAAHKAGENKPRQVGEVSNKALFAELEVGLQNKGGRGKIDKTKAAIVADAKKHGIGKRTVERAIAKTQPKKEETSPASKPVLRRPLSRSRSLRPTPALMRLADTMPTSSLSSVSRSARRRLTSCCSYSSRCLRWWRHDRHPETEPQQGREAARRGAAQTVAAISRSASARLDRPPHP